MAHQPVMAKADKKPPAAIWKEAHHFNPWLAGEDGRAVIAEVLPAKWRLVSADHQQVAGDLFVDVLGKTALGETVIVEAQLGQSNHDHLGKLVTYAAIYDAGAAVWIANEARTEHQEAINFLNQGSTTEFFLVKLEAVVIGDSPPAPLLTLMAGPTLEFKRAGEVKAALKRRDALRIAFWEAFLPEAAAVNPRFARANRGPRIASALQPAACAYVMSLGSANTPAPRSLSSIRFQRERSPSQHRSCRSSNRSAEKSSRS